MPLHRGAAAARRGVGVGAPSSRSATLIVAPESWSWRKPKKPPAYHAARQNLKSASGRAVAAQSFRYGDCATGAPCCRSPPPTRPRDLIGEIRELLIRDHEFLPALISGWQLATFDFELRHEKLAKPTIQIWNFNKLNGCLPEHTPEQRGPPRVSPTGGGPGGFRSAEARGPTN